jgi:hypothetical protein
MPRGCQFGRVFVLGFEHQYERASKVGHLVSGSLIVPPTTLTFYGICGLGRRFFFLPKAN